MGPGCLQRVAESFDKLLMKQGCSRREPGVSSYCFCSDWRLDEDVGGGWGQLQITFLFHDESPCQSADIGE